MISQLSTLNFSVCFFSLSMSVFFSFCMSVSFCPYFFYFFSSIFFSFIFFLFFFFSFFFFFSVFLFPRLWFFFFFFLQIYVNAFCLKLNRDFDFLKDFFSIHSRAIQLILLLQKFRFNFVNFCFFVCSQAERKKEKLWN